MKKTLVICASAICIAGVLFAVWPLFGRNYIPTHDGEYHIIRIVEFSRMLGAGYLIPRWAPDMNSGYGIPIFNYHYPLPNYVGSLARVFTHDAVYAFQISMGLGYILLAVAAYLWLSTLFGVVPALIGTTVAAFVPYLFVDMYVRGTIGEIWAMAFLFLSLFAVEKKRCVWFALTFGLLVLSHNILALLFAPFLLFYCVLRDRKALWGMAAGLGLSAFFWLPALAEQKFVVGLNTVNFREHFVRMYELLIPSWGTQFSGTGSFGKSISFQLGIAPIIAILAAIWVVRREKEKGIKQLTIYLLLVFLLCILFMFRFSRAIWEIMKPLQLIQYPWRLLSFIIPMTAYAAGYWVNRMKQRWWGIVFAVFAVTVAYSYARPVLYEPRSESYYMSRPNFTDGTSSMGNSFSTIWTGWKNVRPGAPYTIENGQLIGQTRWKYMEKDFTVFMDETGTVTVGTLYFPGWIASVDGNEVPINYREDGIIRISVPQGFHAISVRFTDTPVRRVGNALSIVSVAVLAILGYTSFYEDSHRHNSSGIRTSCTGSRRVYEEPH
jgi:hypothetical protein